MNLFLKLSVAVFNDLKVLRGLRRRSVIWYSARMYLGSPGSDGVGGFVVCGVPLFVNFRSFSRRVVYLALVRCWWVSTSRTGSPGRSIPLTKS